jgi:hypothetical protein
MNQKDVHKEELGYEVPKGYFESSKKDMLHFFNTEEKKISVFFGTKTMLTAAVFGIMAFVFLLNQKQQLTNYEINTFEELIIESLELSEEDFDDWFDEKFVFSEV